MSTDFPHEPTNASLPASPVIPVLGYPDVPAAVAWLCHAFGFVERLRIGTHRVQLSIGIGALVIAQSSGAEPSGMASQSLMIRVANADDHCARAKEAGAVIAPAPADQPYGERQYGARDPWGHGWVFTQTLADVEPGSWGGVWAGKRGDVEEGNA